MTRLSNPMDWCALDKIIAEKDLKVVYRVARCQHGKTRQQTCVDCEGGYVTDMHTFANIGNCAYLNNEPMYAVSDDGEDVMYVPEREQVKL